MKDWKRPVRIVAVEDAEVRNPEWRAELKEWANKMENRFGEEETPVGPIVTKEWIKYVEELERQKEDLRELLDRWQLRHDDEITMLEKAAWGTAIEELEAVLEE